MGNFCICEPKVVNEAKSIDLDSSIDVDTYTCLNTNNNYNNTTSTASQKINFDFSNPGAGGNKQPMVMNFLNPVTGKYTRMMVRKLDKKSSL